MSFFPKPKIKSTLLEFIPKKNIIKLRNPKNLENITKIFFSQRRKMVKKNFTRLFKDYVGLQNKINLSIIIKQSKVPVIVDAGLGTASDATVAMEMGCKGVLVNSAIAQAKNPILMAQSFKDAVIAGRKSFLAGRMKKTSFARASSPKKGLI